MYIVPADAKWDLKEQKLISQLVTIYVAIGVVIIILGRKGRQQLLIDPTVTNYSLHNYKCSVSWFENTARLFTSISGGGSI